MPSDGVLSGDPLFRPLDVSVLSADHILGVAAGTLASVRMVDMFPVDTCGRIVDSLRDIPLVSYDPARVNPPIARFGPVLNDYRRDGRLVDGYWAAAAAARALQERLPADPLAHCLKHFQDAWPGPVRRAHSAGRETFAGTIREINSGARVHYDEIVREFPRGVLDDPVVAQLAFNLYLAMPAAGGETTIWRRRWDPRDESVRDGYGYAESAVAEAQQVTARPAVGDGLLFDPRNYHAVRPGRSGRRIAVSFFLGLTGLGDLVIWS